MHISLKYYTCIQNHRHFLPAISITSNLLSTNLSLRLNIAPTAALCSAFRGRVKSKSVAWFILHKTQKGGGAKIQKQTRGRPFVFKAALKVRPFSRSEAIPHSRASLVIDNIQHWIKRVTVRLSFRTPSSLRFGGGLVIASFISSLPSPALPPAGGFVCAPTCAPLRPTVDTISKT